MTGGSSNAQAEELDEMSKLQLVLAKMQVSGTQRYKDVVVAGAEFANGFSEMLGLNVKGDVSKATRLNPGMFEAIMSWFVKQHPPPTFEVSSFQINLNMQTKVHRDGANAGWSALIANGQFVGAGPPFLGSGRRRVLRDRDKQCATSST